MSNILFLTTMYPDPVRHNTKVCHFFAQEWVKMGHKVIVINIRSMFPRIFTDLAGLFPKLAFRYIGNDVEMDRNMNIVEHKVDDVNVYSVPIYKYIPHGKYPKKSINNMVATIEDICRKNSFEPDEIVGHFYNPTAELIYELKQKHPEVKSSLVFHEPSYGMEKNYKKNAREILDSFDILGFRHKTMKEWYEKAFGPFKNTFICYSGTKKVFLDTPATSHKVFTGEALTEFLFVGQLTYNKCVQETVDALHRCYPEGGFHLTCIGSGGTAFDDIQKDIASYGLQDNVSFTGQIPRDEIIKYYDKSQVFILISKSEAFGLVYLEAMSRGCICIGTRGQGIDGVIVDGENGFLCGGGDATELASVIHRINTLSIADKERISNAARNTAERLSDFNVAKMYIEAVEKS